jgi:cysteine desulfurase
MGFALALERVRVRERAVVVGSRLDHPTLQRLVEDAGKRGFDVRWLALPEGVPSDADRELLREASLVAVSLVNHELGTSLMASLTEVPPSAMRVLDAVQAAPWLPLDAHADDRTFLALSGAKLGAPMGVGVLRAPAACYYAARERKAPLESDSPPWALAIALGAACEGRSEQREELLAKARAAGDELLTGLRALEPDLLVNGAEDARLGTIVNVSFPGLLAKSVVSALSLEGVCISHTAACQARSAEMSPVVRAAYPSSVERAASATRWSVSETVTRDEIARALEALRRVLDVQRGRS